MTKHIVYSSGTLDVETKTITVREVYEALEKDGFKHLRGNWFETNILEDGKFVPVGGCVMAQAAINLGIAAWSGNVSKAVSDAAGYAYLIPNNAGDDDYANHLTLVDQLDKFNPFQGNRASKWLCDSVGLASAIIYWNDRKKFNEAGTDYLRTLTYDYVYELETYADVAAMAKELMEPFFDETIEVIVASREAGAAVPLVHVA